MWPDTTNTEYYEDDLKDLEFPVVFKICPTIGFDQKKLLTVGYKSVGNYFYGQSPFNTSVYGWTGHMQQSSNGSSYSGEGNNHDILTR